MTKIIQSGANTINILIAEDDPMDVDLLKMALSLSDWELPYKTHVCSDGQKLLDYLNSSTHYKIDIIVLDINMPRLDGISALKLLRQHPRWSKIPVILYSSFESGATMRKYFNTGANDFFEKPLNPKGYFGLVEKIQNLLGHSQNDVKKTLVEEEAAA